MARDENDLETKIGSVLGRKKAQLDEFANSPPSPYRPNASEAMTDER
jgi:hypothetical protein